jgi:hypothetical protein
VLAEVKEDNFVDGLLPAVGGPIEASARPACGRILRHKVPHFARGAPMIGSATLRLKISLASAQNCLNS